MLTVVMPAHNEQDYLRTSVLSVLSGLQDGGPFEIIIVENGSADATIDVARALEAESSEVRVLRLAQADYGLALRAGLLAAAGDWVVVFDVDLVDLVFLAAARQEADRKGSAIVVGSKRGPGAQDRRSLPRKLITACFTLLLRFGFGLRVSDTHGVKLLHGSILGPLVEASLFGRDIFDTELILRAERAGLIVSEVPVCVQEARPPRSPISRRIPRTLLGLTKLRIALWREPLGR